MSTSGYGLVGIALHQSEFFQAFRHQTADGEVHISIFYPRLGYLEHIVVTGLHDGIDLLLALRELAVDGHRARIVGTVVIEFAACITKCQTACLQTIV